MGEYVDCVEAYEATLGAYIQSAVADYPELGGIMFALFGFLWVHSTYGNYPLCTSIDSSTGELVQYNIDAADMAAMDLNECSTNELSACSADCASSKDKMEDAYCFSDCMALCYSSVV